MLEKEPEDAEPDPVAEVDSDHWSDSESFEDQEILEMEREQDISIAAQLATINEINER